MTRIQQTTKTLLGTAGLSIVLAFTAITSPGAGRENKVAGAEPSGILASQAQGTGVAGDEIKSMIAKYAKSIDDADTALASQIWSSSTEVSFIHPLGHEHNLEQIKQNVYRHLMGETFSERKLSPRDISIHVYSDAAWAEFYWDFTAKFRKDGTAITTHGRETQIYRKEQGGWRLVHVHYSAMPVTEQPKGF
ncbi:MAG TPA: nuclear transport factor 2 family protein [Terriglobia bacterium]|nr:nuclear transport factor 2 family protein [Terriglobia bacterium]